MEHIDRTIDKTNTKSNKNITSETLLNEDPQERSSEASLDPGPDEASGAMGAPSPLGSRMTSRSGSSWIQSESATPTPHY